MATQYEKEGVWMLEDFVCDAIPTTTKQPTEKKSLKNAAAAKVTARPKKQNRGKRKADDKQAE